MRNYKLRTDLKRAVIGTFALPLGIEPLNLPAPNQGYTLEFTEGEDGEPDGWSFHVVASHDRMAGLVREAFGLLPEEVTPIAEVGSRDAYRSMDVFIAQQPLPFEHFLETWEAFEPVILEDASIGVGANAEDPFVEVFLDSWKGLLIHVPDDMKGQVERMLRRHSLREVEHTWPEDLDEQEMPSQVREVLQIEDEESPDLDEVLLQMRERWDLQLDVDPTGNVDDAGRELGNTLWYGIALCRPASHMERAAPTSPCGSRQAALRKWSSWQPSAWNTKVDGASRTSTRSTASPSTSGPRNSATCPCATAPQACIWCSRKSGSQLASARYRPCRIA